MTFQISRFFWVPVALFLISCESTPVAEKVAEKVAEDSVGSNWVTSVQQIEKSPNDTRDYRYLALANGLQVVLISDLKADKAAASLTAFRGSFHDPSDRLGLAHFLEHMLFIGTEKYPEPDGYFSFVQTHGGSSNAYTATDHTNYFFDIQPEAFHEGLDRFAQFFISPLLQKEYVDREKNAVNSEYQLQMKDDGWRSFVVQKVASNPDHPISKFNIGSLETLKGDVHASLVTFFEENYSANQMALVVLSNETLDEMQPWVTETFLPIKNRHLEVSKINKPIFKKEQLPAKLAFDNIKDTHWVGYDFPISSIQTHYRKKPVQYISNLLGHEGDGSLHALLNEKGWIKGLSAVASQMDADNGVLSVNISLTDAGSAHVEEISAYLFAYLDLLKNGQIEEQLYQEQATVAQLAFRFSEKTSAMNTVRSIAPTLQHYPAEDLLVAPYLMEEFDASLIKSFLSQLTKDNVMMTLSSPDYTGQSTEAWFGVSYDLELGDIALATVDSSTLVLPEANPFLPESLDLTQADELGPTPVIAGNGLELYMDTDLEFNVPRAVIHVSLRNDGGFITLEDVAQSQLYSLLVQDDLNALAYPALLAGISYQIAAPPKGFRISVGGYNDKQLVLLEEVLRRLMKLDIKKNRFDVMQGEFIKDLANSLKNKPFFQSYQRLQDELLDSNWTAEQLIGAVEQITPDSLTAWRDRVLQEVSIQGLVHGNVTQGRVEELAGLLKQHIRIEDVAPASPLVVELEGASSTLLEIDHNDASMVLYVQDEQASFENRARSALLKHLVAPGFFSALRTEQQLGYVVSAVHTQLRDHGGISFVIQSPVVGPDILRDETLVFMAAQEQVLSEMSEKEFGANKEGLIAKLTQRDKNLSQRSARYWGDLDKGVLTFDSKMQLAKAVSGLSKDDMQSFLKEVNGKLGNQYMMVYSEGKFASP
ncbi:MAG: insulinase family protein [Candidatus Azotimanducaceae bacterium WSBS_2022_MAG_OTU7]